MSYKTILVSLDYVEQAESLMKAAVQLASSSDAHLIGTYIVQPVAPYVGFYGDLAVSVEIDQLLVKRQNEQAAKLRSIFEKATQSQTFVSEWRAVSYGIDSPKDTLVEMSGRVDLLVVGSSDATRSDAHRNDRGVLTTILCGSACPVLVVPEQYDGDSLGDYVMLAYDGGRESSRAIFASLPLLKKARSVWLHRINSPNDEESHMDDGMRDVADALSRHGVKLETGTSRAKARKVGKRLLSVTDEHGADCLVMGAPARGKLRDLVLGSAARYTIQKCKVPILFSA